MIGRGIVRIHLDMAAVEAFVLVADLKSFTQAAALLNLTQAGVSVKIRRLEETLARRLLVRTPRLVRLSAEGEMFLERARTLLEVQDLAVDLSIETGRQLSLGLSDHLMGPDLPRILARVNSYDPSLNIRVRIDSSINLANAFSKGTLDCVFVLQYGKSSKSDVLIKDLFGWLGALKTTVAKRPISLITVDEACGVRAVATEILNRSKIEWIDMFIGGGVATVVEAAKAGMGIAPLPMRFARAGLTNLGPEIGISPLPHGEIVMRCRPIESKTYDTVRSLAATLRSEFELGCKEFP